MALPIQLGAAIHSAAQPSLVTSMEAQILVYVSPIGDPVRADGFDIGMELQTGAKLNQSDYYYFFVYNSKRESHGSNTVGYVAVNKRTADVWDTDLNKRLTSKVLVGVQETIRQSHAIDTATIEKYRGKPF